MPIRRLGPSSSFSSCPNPLEPDGGMIRWCLPSAACIARSIEDDASLLEMIAASSSFMSAAPWWEVLACGRVSIEAFWPSGSALWRAEGTLNSESECPGVRTPAKRLPRVADDNQTCGLCAARRRPRRWLAVETSAALTIAPACWGNIEHEDNTWERPTNIPVFSSYTSHQKTPSSEGGELRSERVWCGKEVDRSRRRVTRTPY